jgi:acyl-CoA synthetase (AMP-forming)/AMP-acid ligase II
MNGTRRRGRLADPRIEARLVGQGGRTVAPGEARLPTAYKRPSEIIIADALLAASTGKILEHRLADAAHERAIGQVIGG